MDNVEQNLSDRTSIRVGGRSRDQRQERRQLALQAPSKAGLFRLGRRVGKVTFMVATIGLATYGGVILWSTWQGQQEASRAASVFYAAGHAKEQPISQIRKLENPWAFLYQRDNQTFSEIIIGGERFYLVSVKAVDEAAKAQGTTETVQP